MGMCVLTWGQGCTGQDCAHVITIHYQSLGEKCHSPAPLSLSPALAGRGLRSPCQAGGEGSFERPHGAGSWPHLDAHSGIPSPAGFGPWEGGICSKQGWGTEPREAVSPSSAIIFPGRAEVGSLCSDVSCHSSAGPCPAWKYAGMGGWEISQVSGTRVLISSPTSPWLCGLGQGIQLL